MVSAYSSQKKQAACWGSESSSWIHTPLLPLEDSWFPETTLTTFQILAFNYLWVHKKWLRDSYKWTLCWKVNDIVRVSNLINCTMAKYVEAEVSVYSLFLRILVEGKIKHCDTHFHNQCYIITTFTFFFLMSSTLLCTWKSKSPTFKSPNLAHRHVLQAWYRLGFLFLFIFGLVWFILFQLVEREYEHIPEKKEGKDKGKDLCCLQRHRGKSKWAREARRKLPGPDPWKYPGRAGGHARLSKTRTGWRGVTQISG